MKLADLSGLVDRLKLVRGVESDLRRRRSRGTLAVVGALVLQLVLALADTDYINQLGRFIVAVARGDWLAITQLVGGDGGAEAVGFAALVAGASLYIVLRRTHLMLHDSQQPFHYTFSVDPFAQVSLSAETTAAAELPPSGRLRLLHHDIMDKLSSNIRRLSLLQLDDTNASTGDLSSHIHICGHYVVRDEATIEVRPRIRIGGKDRPEQLAPVIEVPLAAAWVKGDIAQGDYVQLVEYVYSRIATAVYQQIREDIREKIKLYPTQYVRAVGLFHEANDFEQSNTVDAYDHAIELYREALRYFDGRRTRAVSRWVLIDPVFWITVRRAQLLEARARVAYCRCLIYRRIVSALSGRRQNALFEVPDQLCEARRVLRLLYEHSSRRALQLRPITVEDVDMVRGADLSDTQTEAYALIERYLTYPRDAVASRRRPMFDEHRAALFEAFAITSLAYSQLSSPTPARRALAMARATAPDLAERSPLFLLAVAETTPDLEEKLRGLLNAFELAPLSEIVCYQLAHHANMRFRQRNELSRARAEPIAEAFERVQRINRGNIGAYAANGYLWWLLDDAVAATREYREGLSVKAISQQTFVGDLNYGLARTAAEAGRFDEAIALFAQAVAADPGVGVFSSTTGKSLNVYYESITDSMVLRYETFMNRVRASAQAGSSPAAAGPATPLVSERTRNAVLSFAVSDYANACFQYHTRTGRPEMLERAIRHYKEAVALNPESAVAHFNLSVALAWTHTPEEGLGYLETAERLAPSWRPLLLQSIDTNLGQISLSLRTLSAETDQLRARMEDLRAERLRVLEELAEVEASKSPREPTYESSARSSVVTAPRAENRMMTAPPGLEQSTARTAGAVMQRTAARQSALEAQRDRINDELQKHSERLAADEVKILRLREDRRGRIVPKLHEVLRGSAFTAFFEGLDMDDLASAGRKFLAKSLRKDDVGEDFVELLRVWASLLVEEEGAESRACCGALCSYILSQLYPEHYSVHLMRLRLYAAVDDHRAERVDSIFAVRAAIDDVLCNDPTNWYYLELAVNYLEMQLLELDPEVTDVVTAIRAAAGPQRVPGLVDECLRAHGVMLSARAKLVANAVDSWQITDPEQGRTYRLSLKTSRGPVSVTPGGRTKIDVLRTALENQDDRSDRQKISLLNCMLARECAACGDDDKATLEYQRAIANDPTNGTYDNMLGDHHHARGRYPEAAHAYRNAIGKDPDVDLYYSNLASAEERQTDTRAPDSAEHWGEAVAALERALELRPESTRYAERLQRARMEFRLHAYLDGNPMLPLVVPLALEVSEAAPILAAAAGWDGRATNMRITVEDETGVGIPGIRLRTEPGLELGEYRVLINELAVEHGRLDAALAAGDAADALLTRVAAVVRSNLTEFVGHQEIMDRLSDSELRARYESDADVLADLVVAVRERLRRTGKLGDFEELVQAVADGTYVPDTQPAAAEVVHV